MMISLVDASFSFADKTEERYGDVRSVVGGVALLCGNKADEPLQRARR